MPDPERECVRQSIEDTQALRPKGGVMRRILTVFLPGLVVAVAVFAWVAVGQSPTRNHLLNYSQFMLAGAAALALTLTSAVASCPVARRRRVGTWVATASLVMVVALGGYEARCYLTTPRQFDDNPWTFASGQALVADPDLPFGRPPHLSWTGVSRGDLAVMSGRADRYATEVTFQTDHEGFRNSRQMTRADLVFIGGAFTEAGNVPEAETFVQQTAVKLGKTARNLGRAGYAPPMALVVLRRNAMNCRPKVVVWQVSGDDFPGAYYYRRWLSRGRPPYQRRPDPVAPSRAQNWVRRSPTFWAYAMAAGLQMQAKEWSGAFRDAQGRTHWVRHKTVPNPRAAPAEDPIRDDITRPIALGSALLAAKDINLLVVLVPTKFRAMAASLEFDSETAEGLRGFGLGTPQWDLPASKTAAAVLEAHCRRLNIPFVDATAALRRHAEAGTLVYPPNDSHLSAEGHRVVSNLIVEHVRGLLSDEQAPALRERGNSKAARHVPAGG